MIEFFGWMQAICLSICGLPQAVGSYRKKSSLGMTWGFLSLWFLGEISLLIYAIWGLGFNVPVISQAIPNIFFICVIAYYK